MGGEFELGGVVGFKAAIEAGLIADVALALVDTDLEDDAVLVAVGEDFLDVLDVA